MILVRDVFHLKFGAARQANEEWHKGFKILRKSDNRSVRLLTDLVGPYYTLVLESTYDSLTDFERGHQAVGKSKTWQAWYRRFTPLVEHGYREIFTIVE